MKKIISIFYSIISILYKVDEFEGFFLIDSFFILRGKKTTIIFLLVK